MSDLTSDNIALSRPNGDPDRAFLGPRLQLTAIGDGDLPDRIAALVQDSIAPNTRRAYLSDLGHFERWGGCIPANDRMVAAYLADHAETLRVSTLVRRLASISKAHVARGCSNPVNSALVRATLRGIKRRQGWAQSRAKPLLKEKLFSVIDATGDTLRDARDRALLLIGFAGAFRRSELVALDKEDLEPARQGIIIQLRRSKTDQTREGRQVAIPHGRTRWCPVLALETWFERSGISDGPVFRPIDRHGHIIEMRLSGEAVSLVIKERVAAAGIDPAGYSGHSLRAGFVTSAAQAGVPPWRIRQQTGHTTDAMLGRYIRNGQLFAHDAAQTLL